MDAGRLDKRIIIERLEATEDEIGQPVEAWIPTFNVWAAIEPLTGREYLAAMAVQAERTVRIRIRYLPGIVSTMRVVYQGRVFAIQSVINIREGNDELHLMGLEQA